MEVRSITTAPARTDVSTVTVDLALSIPAVFRSIQILQTMVSSMDLAVYRNNVEIATPPLIKRPNVNDTPRGFVKETVFSLAAYGNAYWRLHRSDAASPVQSIEVLSPDTVSITHDQNGRRRYYIGNKEYQAWQIAHLKLMERPGEIFGTGPIQASKSALLGAIRLRDFADNWFNTSGVPTGFLQFDREFNATEAAELAEAWKAFINDHGGTGILPPGVTYVPVHIKPAEAQFLEVQQASVAEIARLFGIPQVHLLATVEGSSNTYLNLEQANIVFLQNTLAAYMNEIEDALTDLLPRGQRVGFREDQLLRMDSNTKWSVAEKQVNVGYTTGDELREQDGKKPLPKQQKEAPADGVS